MVGPLPLRGSILKQGSKEGKEARGSSRTGASVTFSATPPSYLESAPKEPTGAWQEEKESRTSVISTEVPEPLVLFKRVRITDGGASPMMGCCWRNCITGEISIRPRSSSKFPDFDLVDLYRRPALPINMLELEGDPYLFKPVVMGYRTWLYHEVFRRGTYIPGGQGSEVVAHVLAQYCIDTPHVGPQSLSSLRIFAPLLLTVGFTQDNRLAIAAACLGACVAFISAGANRPSIYRFERLLTFPFRTMFLIYVFTRMTGADILAWFGYITCIVAFILDLIVGDILWLFQYKWTCHYTVVKEMSKRVYACDRTGAAALLVRGEFYSVDERITGFSPWQNNYALIADIGGLIVELQPMKPQDWSELAAKAYKTRRPIPYASLDMVGPFGGQGADFMTDQEWRLFAEDDGQGSEKWPKAGQLTVEDF